MSDAIQIQTEKINWRKFDDATGVHFKVLRKHPNGGISILLKFDSGAKYHTHKHPAGEEYYVLEGTLEDLGKSWPKGSYIWHPEGSIHRPSSKEGCIVLVVLPEAIELV